MSSPVPSLPTTGGRADPAAAGPSCASCGRAVELHGLADARACIAELAKSEPPYCRLTGPSDRDEWARAVARRTVDRLMHPERYEA